MTPASGRRLGFFTCFIAVSLAIAGYFTGLQSPMNPGTLPRPSSESMASPVDMVPRESGAATNIDTRVIPATHYLDMRQATELQTRQWQTTLVGLESKNTLNPDLEIHITDQEKLFALAMRESNRSFNGAPPTVPHPIEQMNSTSCMACHGEGAVFDTLRISKMSHQYLENCTQCHVESSPQHMEPVLFQENGFVGLPAPTGGPTAFEGAPPLIPHSTWMRVDCMSCHGTTGMYGIQSTHPWRQNCLQCHASSSQLDQTLLPSEPAFLPGIDVNE